MGLFSDYLPVTITCLELHAGISDGIPSPSPFMDLLSPRRRSIAAAMAMPGRHEDITKNLCVRIV